MWAPPDWKTGGLPGLVVEVGWRIPNTGRLLRAVFNTNQRPYPASSGAAGWVGWFPSRVRPQMETALSTSTDVGGYFVGS